jgi:hypothetical protein
VDADSMRFENFAQLIESNSNYFFYYDTAQTNKLSIKIHAQHQTLENILDKIFVNSDFHYAIDEDNHVFVTSSFAIQMELPKNFLNNQEIKNDTLHTTPQIELTGQPGGETKNEDVGRKQVVRDRR